MAKLKKQLAGKGYAWEKDFDFFPFKLVTLYTDGNDLDALTQSYEGKYPELIMLRGDDLVGGKNVSAFVFNHPQSTNIFLCLKKGITVSILVHECVHVVARILQIMGSKMDESTEEFFAYIQQTIFKDIHQTLTSKLKIKMEL